MTRELMQHFILQYIEDTHKNRFYSLMEDIALGHIFYLKTIKEKW